MTSTSEAHYRHLRTRHRGTDLLPGPPVWTARALCARVGTPEDWAPPPADQEAVAAAIEACGHCPVRTDCLQEALERPRRAWGTIRGGMTDDQRRKARRAHTRAAPVGRTMEPALEVARMAQALAADGHPRSLLQRQAQVSRSTLTELRTGRSATVASDVADRIRRAYARIREWDPGSGPHVARVRRTAAARGWAPSRAWEGLDMADPTVHAHTETTVAAV